MPKHFGKSTGFDIFRTPFLVKDKSSPSEGISMFSCPKFIADTKSFLEPSFKAQLQVALVSDENGAKPVPDKVIIILDINVFLVPAEKTII